MKKNNLLLPIFIGLTALTIIMALYSADKQILKTVFAQNPNVVGCFSHTEVQNIDCYCEGGSSPNTLSSVVDPYGNGYKGFVPTTATCQVYGENGSITCQSDVNLPEDNLTLL